jgi:hypothetical protein
LHNLFIVAFVIANVVIIVVVIVVTYYIIIVIIIDGSIEVTVTRKVKYKILDWNWLGIGSSGWL